MTARPIALRDAAGWRRLRVGLRRLRIARPTLADTPVWAGAAAAMLGTIVLIGWLLDVETLKSIIPAAVTVKANAGLCLLLLGSGVVILSRTAEASRGRSLGSALVAGATLIAFATSAEYATQTDLGIDQLLAHDYLGGAGASSAGRMSPITAMSLLLLGGTTLVAGRSPRSVIAAAGFGLATSALTLVAFAFDAAPPSFLLGYTQMAPATAIAAAILSMGVIGLLGAANPFVILTGRSPTARLSRRLLAVTVGVPIILSWLRLHGQQLGLYDTSYGTALLLVGILAFGVVAILRSANWARALETEREAIEIERDRFFELSVDMLSVVGDDGRFKRANGAWERTLGYRPEDLIGRPYLEFVHLDDLERTIAQDVRHYELGERVEAFQNRYRHRDGSYRWLEWMSQAAPDGSVAFAVARDVTERKARDDRRARQHHALEVRNEALRERAVRDPLTGLHNRRYFDATVARLERRWRRLPVDRRPPVSVVMFDLDHFGLLNKNHGHQAGDAVLRVFADLLKRRFREKDLVARYGGEEFVAIIEGAGSVDAIRIAEEVRVAFEALAIDIGTDTPLRVTVSAGCAQLGDDRSASSGLSLADVWLSQAKRAGRNQVVGL